MKELNVVYVEDDDNDVTLLRYAMRKAEINVPMSRLADGQAAIEYLSGHGKYRDREKYPLPDLMLLDIKMPVMDGLHVLKWVRAHPEFAGLVIIMMSSSDEAGDVRRAYERGANSDVVKSPDLQSQLKIVRAFHAWWCEVNCCAPAKRTPREH
jgi:CheY-like chemotaxis protein